MTIVIELKKDAQTYNDINPIIIEADNIDDFLRIIKSDRFKRIHKFDDRIFNQIYERLDNLKDVCFDNERDDFDNLDGFINGHIDDVRFKVAGEYEFVEFFMYEALDHLTIDNV